MLSSRTLTPALAALVALGTASASHAQNIPVQNFSFESPAVSTFTTNVITGWSGGGGAGYGVQNLAAGPSLFPGGIPDGTQYAYVNTGYIFQDLGLSLTAGNTYTLTAYVGKRTDNAGAAGSINLASFTSGLPVAFLAQSGSVTSPSGTFTKYTTSFTATGAQAGQDFGIVLNDTGTGQVDFDNVSLTQSSPVPEASTTVSFGLLLALGMGRLVVAAKRKKVQSAP